VNILSVNALETLKNNHDDADLKLVLSLSEQVQKGQKLHVVLAKTTLFVVMESEAVNLACLCDKRPLHYTEAKVALIQTQNKFPSIPCRVRVD